MLRNPVNLDRVSFALFVATLIWLPLPLGSNRDWAWSIAEVAVLLNLGIVLLFSSELRRRLLDNARALRPALVLFGLWLAYILFQTIDLGALLSRFAPATAALYDTVSPWVGTRPGSIAIDRTVALDELERQFTYISLFVLTLILVGSRRRLRLLALILTGIGLLEAAYGLVILLAGDTIHVWRPEWLGHQVVTGTFVNRNHYAAHIAMTLALGLGLLYSDLYRQRLRARGLKQQLRNLLGLVMGPRFVGFLALTIMTSALILSHSRGGILAVFGALFIVAILGMFWHRESNVERGLLVIVALLVVSAVYWQGTGSLIERVATMKVGEDERVQVWDSTIDMIADRPLFGVGANNYLWSFPAYRSGARPEVFVNHAHNDYLELLAEYGLVGAVLAGLPILLILASMLDGFRGRHDPLSRGLLFGTLTACIAFLLHAFVEFNFHIPANAGYFFVLLAMGVVAARIERPEPGKKPSEHRRREVSGVSSSNAATGRSRYKISPLKRKT